MGAETVIHHNCGRLVKPSDWDRHRHECYKFRYEGATKASTDNTTTPLTDSEREPESHQGELEERLTDVIIDHNSDDEYHTSDLSQDDIRTTDDDARCAIQ